MSISAAGSRLHAPPHDRTSIVLRRISRSSTSHRLYQRIAPSLLEELEKKSPKDEKGNRKNKLHQWLTEDIGDPMLAQHIHSLIMFQRLALASGFGWNRYVKMVDQVMPKRGNTLELPFPEGSSHVPVLPEA